MPHDLRQALRFTGLTFLLSWGLGGVYLAARLAGFDQLPPMNAQNPILWAFVCAPSAAALVLCAREGTLAKLGTSLITRAPWAWGLTAILFLPCVIVLTVTATSAAAGTENATLPWLIALATTPILFANIAPLGEELGWRGYLLPRLLALMGPFAASAVLAAIWCVWHVPAFFMGGMMAAGWAGFGWWCLGTFALTLAMTVFFIRCNGNVMLSGVIPHAIINAAGPSGFASGSMIEALALTAAALLLFWIAVPHTGLSTLHDPTRSP
jgi:uncharacterized protein